MLSPPPRRRVPARCPSPHGSARAAPGRGGTAPDTDVHTDPHGHDRADRNTSVERDRVLPEAHADAHHGTEEADFLDRAEVAGLLCGGVIDPKLSNVVNVHGGLTFSGPLKIAPEKWAFGFDCAHCDDYTFNPHSILGEHGGVYRDMDYVQNETRKLADQLAVIERELLDGKQASDKPSLMEVLQEADIMISKSTLCDDDLTFFDGWITKWRDVLDRTKGDTR